MENTNKEVMVQEKAALVPLVFDEKQVELIKNTVAKGTDNNQLSLFLYTCKKTGLDPLIRQIYAVVRQTKNGPQMSIQTGIDGYRLIAERTGKYAPGKEPLFKYDKDGKLFSATAYVNKYVAGGWHEVAATAIFKEYFQPNNHIWLKMEHTMLAKCAESLVLRKAFPAEMAGVYTQDEMSQAEELPKNHYQEQAEAKKVIASPVKHTETAPSKPIDAEVVDTASKAVEKTFGTAKVVEGVVTAYYPKTKGPHSCKIDGNTEYYKTWDDKIGLKLKEAHEKEAVMSISYEVKTDKGYTNNFILNVEEIEHKPDTDMPEPSYEDEASPF